MKIASSISKVCGKARETVFSFFGRSMNRHFLRLSAHSGDWMRSKSFAFACCLAQASSVSVLANWMRLRRSTLRPWRRKRSGFSSPARVSSGVLYCL